MRVTRLQISNYRSFGQVQDIHFPTPHSALVGKNNAGKTNIFDALDLMLGNRNPLYRQLDDEDFFDVNQPIEIEITIGDFAKDEHKILYGIAQIFERATAKTTSKEEQQTDQEVLFDMQQEVVARTQELSEVTTTKFTQSLTKHIKAGTPEVTLKLKRANPKEEVNESEEEILDEEEVNSFYINLWGIEQRYSRKKTEIVRRRLAKNLLVPAIRDSRNELTASRWTQFGMLMKDILENSPKYSEIRSALSELNQKIQEVFSSEKKKLLENAKVVSYVDDLSFQLTKENHPSELLRNLEIFVIEAGKSINIDRIGTGTQSAIIIGILELALKNKGDKFKLFSIEEPEAFIHPHGVRYLGQLIKKIPEDAMTQVLISTHSISLVSNFLPSEIVRVSKEEGETRISQNPNFDSQHFKRFLTQDNAEMFFSDRLLFIEGPTEKHLLGNLDKITTLNPLDQNSVNCNFDRINLGIIQLNSVDSILNYIKIAKAFDIPYSAIIDLDFISDPSKQNKCEELCQEVGATFQTTDREKLINDLKLKKIVVNNKGEIEDIFSDDEIANISGKSIAEIKALKSRNPQKTSKAFKKIFGLGKPEYAIMIADYYIKNSFPHPLEDAIRNIYKDEVININF